jgi:hypothetical protein
VTDQPLRSNQHYVPCTYLKRWASSDGRIWTYRTLVSSPQVPLWKAYGSKGVAYHRHLYTRVMAGQETDTFEQWLDAEIETPAAEALEKATSDAQLTPDDWKRLVRFLAAQQVRIPRWFAEQVRHWKAVLPNLMKETLDSSVQRFKEEIAQFGQPLPPSNPVDLENIPLRTITKREPGQNTLQLGAEVLVGRAFWLSRMHSALTRVVPALYQHRWTILLPPKGLTWFTSDDPVVRLHFHSRTEYTFDGGWGTPGTAIFMPLGPQHLLYTQVGQRPPPRGERMSHDFARFVRRWIAEHAHRMIFAAERDGDVPILRPRQEDAEAYQREQEHWSRWHDQQTAAEQEWGGTENG